MAHEHPHPSHPHPSHLHPIVPGFGADRAPHYDAQAAMALAGSAALYELGACTLASQLDGQDAASLLFVGVGTGMELLSFLPLEVPNWRFTGVDPSSAMLDVARARLEKEGLSARTHLHLGELQSLPEGPLFDGAQMNGVLHHVDGEEARRALLREVARRLKPGAPLVVGSRVGQDPELFEVELRRWRAKGVSREDLEHRRQGFARMRPIESDAALAQMLAQADFVPPRPIFTSLQFKVFLTRRAG